MFSVQGLIITFMFGYMMAIIVEGTKDIIKYNNPDKWHGFESNTCCVSVEGLHDECFCMKCSL